MSNAKRCQCVEDGANDRLRCADRAGLPRTFHAEGIARGGDAFQCYVQRGQVRGAWYLIVDERSAEHLPGFRVVDGALHQRLADALCQAALNLPDCQHRVDQVAIIIDGRVAVQNGFARFHIDLDFGNVAAVGYGNDVEQIPNVGVQ